MSKRCFTSLLVGAIGGLAMLLTTVTPVVAAPPESSEARLPVVLEELVEDGVINSGQAEAIMEKCEPVFNRIGRMAHACGVPPFLVPPTMRDFLLSPMLVEPVPPHAFRSISWRTPPVSGIPVSYVACSYCTLA